MQFPSLFHRLVALSPNTQITRGYVHCDRRLWDRSCVR